MGLVLWEDDGSPTSAGPLPHSGNSISNTHCLSPCVGAVGLGQGWAGGGVVGVDSPPGFDSDIVCLFPTDRPCRGNEFWLQRDESDGGVGMVLI